MGGGYLFKASVFLDKYNFPNRMWLPKKYISSGLPGSLPFFFYSTCHGMELKQRFFVAAWTTASKIKMNIFIFSDAGPFSPTPGQIGGAVKLSVSYRNGTLFIMVMHIKDLVSDYK